jgi:hypothetical protein
LPEELADEMAAVGLTQVTYGVEGPGWLFSEFEARWQDPVMNERTLWAAQITESDPHLQAISAHLLGIGSRL